MAAKLLLNTDMAPSRDPEAAADAALSLSNPILAKLQQEAGLMAAMRHPFIVARGGWGAGTRWGAPATGACI